MRIAALALSFTVASGALAQTTSTMCQATQFVVADTIIDRTLVGCGEGFPDNLLWHLDRADSVSGALDGKFTRTVTGRGAVIYVIDMGVMALHDEFTGAGGSRVVALDNDAELIDFSSAPTLALQWGFGHGTAAASMAAGERVGVAPDASIVAAPNSNEVSSYKNTLLKIIKHAYAPTTPNAKTSIINISGGLGAGNPNAPDLDALIQRMTTGVDASGNADANGKKFLFVAAAGNHYPGEPFDQCGANAEVLLYPALLGTSIDGVISVGGIDRENRFWTGSCKGALVEVAGPAAPSMFVASTSANNAYRYQPSIQAEGTSWSTGYASGIAALLLELDPNRTPAQLEALMKASASRVDGVPVPLIPEPPKYEGKRRSVRR